MGMESGEISDSQLAASSTHDFESVGPQHARLNRDPVDSGGAWCPKGLVGGEGSAFLEIDLVSARPLTGVLTQGRFGRGRGREFAESFVVEYWRPGMSGFRRISDRFGREVMRGNTNTFEVVETVFDAPVTAQRVRISPVSEHPRSVCMRIELLTKCERAKNFVLAYDMIPPPYVAGSGMVELSDNSYDGEKTAESWTGGLGQLTDGVLGRVIPEFAPKLIGGKSGLAKQRRPSQATIFTF